MLSSVIGVSVVETIVRYDTGEIETDLADHNIFNFLARVNATTHIQLNVRSSGCVSY